MKTNIQKVIVVFILLLSANNASAFAPVPATEGKPFTLYFGLDPQMYFSPSYALTHVGASAAMVYNVWNGLDVGLQVRGGMDDDFNGLFNSSTVYSGDIGGDIMARYLVSSCRFYFGVQTVFGYSFRFDDDVVENDDHHLSLAIGVPLGINFEGAIAVYMMPTVELGRQSATDTGIWGSLVSGSIALGAQINLGGPSLVVEVAPRIDDFSDAADTAGVNTYLGLAFSF